MVVRVPRLPLYHIRTKHFKQFNLPCSVHTESGNLVQCGDVCSSYSFSKPLGFVAFLIKKNQTTCLQSIILYELLCMWLTKMNEPCPLEKIPKVVTRNRPNRQKLEFRQTVLKR